MAIESPPCLANDALEIIHSTPSATDVEEAWIKIFAHPLANVFVFFVFRIVERLREFVEMDNGSCIDYPPPEYVSRMWGGKVELNEIEEAMKAL